MRSWLPNLITTLRGLAGPAVAVLVLGLGQDEVAFALFIAAIATDLVDGWLARQLNATSDLGRVLDPLADKLLIGGTWLTLGLVGWAPWWLAGTMLFRDVLVGLGWLVTRDTPHRPHLFGRLMVSVEGVALPVLLFRNPWLGVHWPSVGLVLGAISLVLAAASGAVYLSRVLGGRDGIPVLRASPWRPPPSTRT